MSKKSRFVFTGYVVAGLLQMATSVEAANYYWDINGTAAGAGGASPSGIWDGSNPAATNWNGNSAGGSSTITNLTTYADPVFFSAGTGATGPFTVTVGNNQYCNGLTVEEGAVSLAGGSISNQAALSVGTVAGTPVSLIINGCFATNKTTCAVGSVAGASGNLLMVTNGGQVVPGGVVSIGLAAGANDNSLVVTGPNSLIRGASEVRLGTSGGTNNSITVTNNGKLYGTIFSVGYSAGSSSNSLIITDGGQVIASGTMRMGNSTGANDNRLVVSAGILTNVTALSVGASSCSGNSMLVTNGGKVYMNISSSTTLAVGGSCINSRLDITGADSLVVASSNRVQLGNAGTNNTITVGDGATLINTNSTSCLLEIGLGNYAIGNSMIVTNKGKVYARLVYIGTGTSNSSNSMVIADGGQVFCYTDCTVGQTGSSAYNFVSIGSSTATKSLWDLGKSPLTVGYGNISTGNYMNVLSGGMVTNVSTLTVGGPVGSSGNSFNLTGGGLLEVNTGIKVGPGSNNSLTNQGGIIQFTTAAPSITTNAGNFIVMDGGTLGYRGIQSGTLPNLTDNVGATGVGRFIWQGNNTFRLDNCFATNTVADGYTFGFGQPNGSKNYTGLELVNGTSGIRGTVPVTIDSTSSLLVSNTTASISGAFTNNGTLTIVNSTLALLNGGTFGEGSTVNWMSTNSTINVNGTLNLPAVMTVNISQGSPYRPNGEVLFTATGFGGPGAASLNGWVIPGARSGTHAVIINGQVQLKTPAGSLIRFY